MSCVTNMSTPNHTTVKQFSSAGKLHMKIYKIGNDITHIKVYRNNGNLSYTVPFKDNKYHGEMLVYYESQEKQGKLKLYDNGETISKTEYDTDGNIIE